uniref:Uncharacterized protein n=1 Tax=Aegilops tauschii subsp. strangulata TaxID=200361 RepID=A0A453BV18_AEGTS
MEEQGERGLQLLLPAAAARALREAPVSAATDHQQLDLDLSMSIGPRSKRAAATVAASAATARQLQQQVTVDVRSVKQQTAEQARMASAERAYAERVRDLAKRELELAEREFARARMIWERAREEVERVERMKQIAARRLGSAASAAALEITCHACMQRFHP